MSAVHVPGSPAGPGRRGSPRWRAAVAGAVRGRDETDGVRLDLGVEPGRWVDLDTLAFEVLAGLRDGGLVAPRFSRLDAVLATRHDSAEPGVLIDPAGADALRAPGAPGPCALDVGAASVPRPGRREDKRRWRERLAAGWGARPALGGAVWVDVTLPSAGSLVAPVEALLDGLEPALGRDPRGRSWQEFFPNDHRILWLRVLRAPPGAALRLRLGPLPAGSGVRAPTAGRRARGG
jgi:hypothetical protein